MTENWKEALAKSRIPNRMHGGIIRWIEHGIQPGGFLVGVLSNNLLVTVGAADEENLLILHEYVRFLYSHAPPLCWGSEEKYRAWHVGHAKARLAAKEAVR